MDQDQRLLDAVVEWYEGARDRLAASAVETQIIEPSFGRTKNSASIEFESRELVIVATIWDSGEAETIAEYVQDERSARVEVIQVKDVLDVRRLLDNVALQMKV